MIISYYARSNVFDVFGLLKFCALNSMVEHDENTLEDPSTDGRVKQVGVSEEFIKF